jgi:8-oxo-dGTP pyrophosphatase MutT (NUDIX family)
VIRLKSPRVAVRGIVLHENRLLLVNAYPGDESDLWCAPGGGAEPGQSLPDNLVREVAEETGLTVTVGAPCLVNEFHDPGSGFHQVDVYFRCEVVGGASIADGWADPEGIVNRRRWVSREEMARLRFKPDSLPEAAWGDGGILYDPLEPIVR